jgi:DNA-binding transcriptional ArsR family regulator
MVTPPGDRAAMRSSHQTRRRVDDEPHTFTPPRPMWRMRRVRTPDGVLLFEVATVSDALSHEARLHIVQLLAHDGPELSSGYLAKRFSHSWPTTTRHLHVLEAAGIVSVRRDGGNCVYRLERDHLQRFVGGWLGFLETSTTNQIWRSPGRRSVTKGSAS